MKQLRTFLIFFLLPVYFITSALVPAAEARMIDTETYLLMEQHQAMKMQVNEFINRDDVRAKLIELGVDPLDAQQRIAHLSSEELKLLQDHIADLPAGAGALAILGIVFIVLLVLALLGTSVFKRI